MSELSDLVPIPPKNQMNANLSSALEKTMLKKFGKPGALTKNCSKPDPGFAEQLVFGENVGPFEVDGLRAAVESLKQIFAELKEKAPEVHAQVRTDGLGMLCVRHKRPNPNSYSNHSWGTAIDLKFGPNEVSQGTHLTQRGFLALFPIFNSFGWYWGAEFSGDSVDSMHFEWAEESILKLALESMPHSNFAELGRSIDLIEAGELESPQEEIHRSLVERTGNPLALSGIPEAILEIAAQSKIAKYHWPGRGVAPIGYLQGMALVYARAYCRLKNDDSFITEMAKADTDEEGDVLTWYAQNFAAHGMDNSVSGPDTLRHLFTLLTGLGMRESSGNYCTGTDDNYTADTAEAGLFQTSWNTHRAAASLPKLFQVYRAAPQSAFLSIFKKGAVCTPDDAINYGTGDGSDFQEMEKTIPEFAAEYTALAMRHVGGKKGNWGPLRRKVAEINPDCHLMFQQVQTAVDNQGLCAAFSALRAPHLFSLREVLTGPLKGIDTDAKTAAGQGAKWKAQGYGAVGVYLRSDRCSKEMLADLRGAGLKIWSVYERGYPDHPGYFTVSRGSLDGTRAADFASSVGQPAGTQIYAAIDYNPDEHDASGPSINGILSQYMAAFQTAVGAKGYVASVYSSGRACRILIQRGLAATGWLSVSSSFAEHQEFIPHASIVQTKVLTSDWDGNTIADPSKPGLW